MKNALDVSSLIGEIYDCAISPDQWSTVLAKICQYSGSAAGTLAVVDLVTGKERTHVNYGISDHYHNLYQEKYHCTDLFLHPLMMRDVGEPVLSADLVSDDELLNSRIYREWAAPQGFRDTIMTMLARNQARLAFLGLTRLLTQPRYQEADRQEVALLARHVQRAVLISDLLEQRSVEKDRFAEVIDSIATATLIIGPDCRIAHSNAAGRAMLDRGSPIAATNGVLLLPNPARAALVPKAEAIALQPETFRIPGPAGEGECVIVVMPLASSRRSRTPAAPQFAVFVQEPNSVAPLASDVWGRLFALTGSELRILQGLIAGSSPAEIADLYGIARSTVKTHLLSLYRKTGTRRQAELVKLALNALPQVRTS